MIHGFISIINYNKKTCEVENIGQSFGYIKQYLFLDKFIFENFFKMIVKTVTICSFLRKLFNIK